MIQRLRWKFVAIIMTVVTLLLAAICSFLFVTVRGSLQEDSISVLRRVITQKGESVVMWDPDSGGILSINPFREQEVSLPYFTVAVNHQGQAAVLYIYFSVFVTAVMLIFNFLFRRKEKEVKA